MGQHRPIFKISPATNTYEHTPQTKTCRFTVFFLLKVYKISTENLVSICIRLDTSRLRNCPVKATFLYLFLTYVIYSQKAEKENHLNVN